MSVPGRDNYHHQPRRPSAFSGSSAAGDLLPGQLYSSPSSVANSKLDQRGGRRMSAPPSPAAAAAAAAAGAFPGAESDAESGEDGDDDEATSPLGVRILERRGESLKGGRRTSAASPTDAVMYEVSGVRVRGVFCPPFRPPLPFCFIAFVTPPCSTAVFCRCDDSGVRGMGELVGLLPLGCLLSLGVCFLNGCVRGAAFR